MNPLDLITALIDAPDYPSWARIGAEVVCIRDKPWPQAPSEKPGPLPQFMQVYVITGRFRHPTRLQPGITLAGVANWVYHVREFAPVQKIEHEQETRVKEKV